jgi:hypothetical protein
MADQQDLELEALRAIYSEDFIDCPPPKVWKVGLLYYLVRTLPQASSPFAPSNDFFADANTVNTLQGAQAVPEFKIRVKASEPLEERVHFFLRVKYESFLFSSGVTCSPIERVEMRLTKTLHYPI